MKGTILALSILLCRAPVFTLKSHSMGAKPSELLLGILQEEPMTSGRVPSVSTWVNTFLETQLLSSRICPGRAPWLPLTMSTASQSPTV